MSVFFLIVAGLAVLAVVVLALSWNRAPAGAAQDPEWQVMLARRREIEEDPQLSATTRASLREEWLRTADASLALADRDNQRTPSRAVLTVLVSVVLGLAIAIYAVFGRWEPAALQSPTTDAAAAKETIDAQQFNAAMAERIVRLQARLKTNPKDLEGWLLLARSYFFTQNYAASAEALERALKLAPRDPSVLADLADSLGAASATHTLAGRPIALIKQALAINPRHPKALALAATHAMETRQAADAVLLSLGVSVPADKPESAKAAQTPAITGSLTFSPALTRLAQEGKLPAQAVLFIFARSANSKGGPPVAVLRVPLAQAMQQKPFPFRLDDSLAMNPANKLSEAGLVDVEARIALGGSVQKQDGDLRAVIKDIKPGSAGLSLQLEAAP
jgi:cytochrome c-type biogenesis protein CcmH